MVNLTRFDPVSEGEFFEGRKNHRIVCSSAGQALNPPFVTYFLSKSSRSSKGEFVKVLEVEHRKNYTFGFIALLEK